ncbi:response regulator transcription factor [Amphritea atlantica]|uniref:Response regulator transcription factor n=1 Tax=Amphritea atlantica TaxID=355243 RepID=A0ABY5GW36_9GAMM|nr:response regulator transcription factor [Amphritea atlantica]
MKEPIYNTSKKILVADKSPLYRQGVKIIIETYQNSFILFEADNSSAILSEFERHSDLDLIIVDTGILDHNYSIKNFISNNSKKVILLCNQLTSHVVEQANFIGVKNIALKKDTLFDLNNDIQTVLDGGCCWPLIESQAIINNARKMVFDRINNLTDRQKMILSYLLKGMNNDQIGHCLGVSKNTVKSHFRNIFCKLKVTNRTQLVAVFYSRDTDGFSLS